MFCCHAVWAFAPPHPRCPMGLPWKMRVRRMHVKQDLKWMQERGEWRRAEPPPAFASGGRRVVAAGTWKRSLALHPTRCLFQVGRRTARPLLAGGRGCLSAQGRPSALETPASPVIREIKSEQAGAGISSFFPDWGSLATIMCHCYHTCGLHWPAGDALGGP